jgi:beta-mannosidase
VLSEDFRFPTGLDLPLQRDARISSQAVRRHDGSIEVTLRSDVFLQAVTIACEGFIPSDNYFHLAPNQDKRLVFAGNGTLHAALDALNLRGQVTFA